MQFAPHKIKCLLLPLFLLVSLTSCARGYKIDRWMEKNCWYSQNSDDLKLRIEKNKKLFRYVEMAMTEAELEAAREEAKRASQGSNMGKPEHWRYYGLRIKEPGEYVLRWDTPNFITYTTVTYVITTRDGLVRDIKRTEGMTGP